VDVIGIDVSRDPFDRGAQLDTFPARTESSQLRHSDQLPPTARHLQQPRGHQETRSGHRQEPNKDRPRQGLAKPVIIIIVRATKPTICLFCLGCVSLEDIPIKFIDNHAD